MAVAGSIFFVADTLNHRIVRFDAETLNWMDSFGEEGKEINQFLGPCTEMAAIKPTDDTEGDLFGRDRSYVTCVPSCPRVLLRRVGCFWYILYVYAHVLPFLIPYIYMCVMY